MKTKLMIEWHKFDESLKFNRNINFHFKGIE